MEIIPGVGVATARIGDRRDDVIARNGPDISSSIIRGDRDVHANHLVVSYTPDDVVELVEHALARNPRNEATWNGIQLTGRLMDDVVADLQARGHEGVEHHIGFVYRPGFALFTMSSLDAHEVGLSDDPHDRREVVEGVAIAPFDYFVS